MAKINPDRKIGPWVLESRLGHGGNADVWSASGPRGRVALKVLRTRGLRADGYKRFRDETAVLRALEKTTGVLPIIDAHLPLPLTKNDRAWLAMPEAVGVRAALGDRPSLISVVQAIAVFAQTLGRLAERGVYHRDLKPENLFRFEGDWVIGDWGLVQFPGKEDLTAPRQRLGPTFYLAPEMLQDAQRAEAGPADVYSLGKTLWVLATGDTYPPQGSFRRDTPDHLMSSRIAHPHVYLLDRLVQRVTRHVPGDRPTMIGVAQELRAWLQLLKATPPVDQHFELSERLYRHIAPDINPRDEVPWEDASQYLPRLLEWAESLLSNLADTLSHLSPCEGVVEQNESIWNTLRFRVARPTGPRVTHQGGRGITVRGPGDIRLCSGLAARIWSSEVLDLAAAHWLWGADQLAYEIWFDERNVIPGSAAEEAAVHDLIGGLERSIPGALERLAHEVEKFALDAGQACGD